MVALYLKGKIMDNYEKARKAYIEACKGINIKQNEKIVLECKNSWCFYFARDIPGADIKAHEQAILEIKNPHYSFWFARDIVRANIEEHFKVILNSGDKEWLNLFIEKINYKNTKVEEWLFYI